MKKILIIQNKRIGDVLISSVIANNFKAKYPDSEVHFMAYDFTHGVILNNPNIDKIISINDKELKKIPVLLKLVRQIQKEKYDIIFDPYSKTQSRIICKFSGAKQTIGHKSRKKFGNWGYYTHPVEISKEKTKICGKAIEDRIHLLNQAGNFDPIDYEPKIFLSETEKKENWLGNYANKKVIVLGVLGSTPQKSMPYDYVAEMVDFIAEKYDVNILFNYAPHQKEEAMKIYAMCQKKENIILDIYAPSIRDFIKLMAQCDALVSNEGGTVHIAKALNKPTFTIFSPYVNKDHWASFEDGKFHHSVHLLEMKPDLFDSFTFEERKKIEANPDELYKQLTPEMILPELDAFLKNNL
ncbi:ADP-heptose:LPS heptosyltransferase [Flavobacterium saliperosum S13]|uniref:Heptosyltransferase-2 n=2 Tax=Flavobacterium saliperosum TaxID=329186 RepID=A0A1G4VSG0_9FLAO|nr:glycosyltransferase family 9 protein [Flavobacterium saliperosum]ESU24028.1 ADP-heptose:LPS heptosyltransferase [Flavobacterium saliperosum S13]SCX11151.1 heptosyltransferase-2 [Flavobacterium saliperosum]